MGQRKSKAGRSNVSVGQINCCVFHGNEHDPMDSNIFTPIQPKIMENTDGLAKAVYHGQPDALTPPSYEESTVTEKP